MNIESLEISLTILNLCGILKPICKQRSRCREVFYFLWRLIFAPMPFLIVVGQIISIVIENLNFDEITELLFILLCMINISCKSFSFIIQQKNLIKLTNMLKTDCAVAWDEKEAKIQHKYRRFIR